LCRDDPVEVATSNGGATIARSFEASKALDVVSTASLLCRGPM
jgi:hypothetical protein